MHTCVSRFDWLWNTEVNRWGRIALVITFHWLERGEQGNSRRRVRHDLSERGVGVYLGVGNTTLIDVSWPVGRVEGRQPCRQHMMNLWTDRCLVNEDQWWVTHSLCSASPWFYSWKYFLLTPPLDSLRSHGSPRITGTCSHWVKGVRTPSPPPPHPPPQKKEKVLIYKYYKFMIGWTLAELINLCALCLG